jgi:flagellar assembly protein FliH
MQSRLHRFDFGTLRDFRAPLIARESVTESPDEIAIAPPPPVFTESDIQAAQLAGKKTGYSEGFNAGKQEALAEISQQTNAANQAIQQLSAMVMEMEQRYHAILLEESRNLTQLLMLIVRKITNDIVEARSEEIASTTVTRALPTLFSRPKLLIDLGPEHFDSTLARIESLLKEAGFEGEVQFRNHPQLGATDIRIDWGSGQITRSQETLWQEVEAIIERIPLEVTFAETLNTTATQPSGEEHGR